MITILYEDKHLVVCIKPIGVASESSGKSGMPKLLQEQLNCTIYPVHRLDQPVSGIMIFAKNVQSAGKISGVFQDDDFVKEYLAVCEGNLSCHTDIWQDLLYHDRHRNKTYVVNRKRNGVKEAKLQFWTLKKIDETSLVKIRLYTGRTHQIRAQFASRSYPLCGDGKYGSHNNHVTCALYSYHVSFTHPFTKKRIDFTSIPKHEPFCLFHETLTTENL